jgi:homoserine dehydrogenase
MTSVVAFDRSCVLSTGLPVGAPPIRVGLLGCGNVGSVFAALAHGRSQGDLRITHALVRDCLRPRPTLPRSVERVADGRALFTAPPDVLVELLGGLEPARTLVLEALQRGIPVVTANKSLLAEHGAELREAATRSSTPLLYEAAVLAGVPFLSTFARRPTAADLTSLVGIANGTSNYILTRAREARCGMEECLADARRLGYVEADPANDIDGIDAAQKLVVLLQHFAHANVRAEAIETGGIRAIDSADLDHAANLGGSLKPVISADWTGRLHAFSAPAFVPLCHPLAPVDGVENAIILNGRRGRLTFRGPGAGPEVTAATVLDDVLEAVTVPRTAVFPRLATVDPSAAITGWFLSIAGSSLPDGLEVADLLASYGIYLQRTSTRGRETFAAVTWPAPRASVQAALGALEAAARCTTRHYRALDL